MNDTDTTFKQSPPHFTDPYFVREISDPSFLPQIAKPHRTACVNYIKLECPGPVRFSPSSINSSSITLAYFSWKVLIKQEIQRKSGYAIQVDEEHLRVQLDTIQSELNAPTQFKASVSCPIRSLIFPYFLKCLILSRLIMSLGYYHICRFYNLIRIGLKRLIVISQLCSTILLIDES